MQSFWEHPWHLRPASVKHHQWFRNVAELHELTTAWLGELQLERPSHQIARGLEKEVTGNLWMLESLSDRKLEDYLDESYPEDLLARLEHTVWAVQSWTLMHLRDRAGAEGSPERAALGSMLEQAAFKQGRLSAEKRWPQLVAGSTSDLETMLLALHEGPLGGGHKQGLQEAYLIRRMTSREIWLELRRCPHETSYPEIRDVAGDLCAIHSHWMRGFLYALNSKASLDHVMRASPDVRCQQRWTL